MEFVRLARDRYELSYQRPLTSDVPIHVKNPPALADLQVISLKRSMLASAGPPGAIAQACPNVQELDISLTQLCDWKQVLQICEELPVSPR